MYTMVKHMTTPLPKPITSLEKYSTLSEVVTIIMVTEMMRRITPSKMHHLLPSTAPRGPVAKHEVKAPRSMKELMIC